MAMMSQSSFLTQHNFDRYKAEFPEDSRLQALSLEELLDNTRGLTLDHILAPLPPGYDRAVVVMSATTVPPCALAIAKVVIDGILLVTGCVALAGKIARPVIQEVGLVANLAASKIGKIISKMAAPNASKTDIAKGFAEILKAIDEAKLFKKIWAAFTKSLTWYYAVLYGIVVLATIAALVTSGGALIVAEFVLLVTSCAFMLIDIADAANTCLLPTPDLTKTVPPATPVPNTNPYVTEPHGGLVTCNGNFLTFAANGGANWIPSQGALQTNGNAIGPSELIEFVPVNRNDYSFAMRVPGTNTYLSALNGGGVSGTPYPVQTNATSLGPAETIAMVMQPSPANTFALCLSNGQYVAVANLDAQISGPIQTVTGTPGPNETFTFKRVPPPPAPKKKS